MSSPSPPSPSTAAAAETLTSGVRNSSNLYLITFLATLLVLLFVSCAVVLRSYVLRRRFPMRLDEAIAAGIILAPRTHGGRRRRIPARPKLFTSWLVQRVGHNWDDIMPLCVLPVQAKRRIRHSLPLPKSNPTIPPPSTSRDGSPFYLIDRMVGAVLRQDDVPRESFPVTQPEKAATQRMDMLQVSLFIAMPSLHQKREPTHNNLGDQEIPSLVLGVTRLPYKPPCNYLL